MSRDTWIPAISLVLLLVTVAYWPGLSGGYVFDDFPNLVDNERTRLESLAPSQLMQGAFASQAGPLSRPVSMLSLSLERYFFGLNPRPMKVTNLLIHLANTLLVFFLVQRIVQLARPTQAISTPALLPPWILALLVCAAWALAPVNLSSVLYVVQRMESLATMFMLLGLLAYLRGRSLMNHGQLKAGLVWIWTGMVVFGGLGLLSKESAIMLPVYALLMEWILFGFGKNNITIRHHLFVLYGIVLLIPGVLGMAWVLPGILAGTGFENRSFTLSERLWTQSRVLWHYLQWIIAPLPGTLNFYHDTFPVSRGPLTPWTSLIGAIGLIALTTIAWLLRHRAPLISLGILWFFVMHLLVSTVLSLELMFEHRNYMGSIGIILAIFALIFSGKRPEHLPVKIVFATAFIALLGFLTFLRANEWGDPLRHAYFEATRQESSPRANYELGKLLIETAPGPGTPSFDLGVETLIYTSNLPNTSILPYTALVFEYSKRGIPVEQSWWDSMKEYVKTQPLSTQDIVGLFTLLDRHIKGIINVDVEQLGSVLYNAHKHNPRHSILATVYANFLVNVAGDMEHGESIMQRITAINPRSAPAWKNLIQHQIVTRQFMAAEASLQRLEELNRFGRFNDDIDRFQAEIDSLGSVYPNPATD